MTTQEKIQAEIEKHEKIVEMLKARLSTIDNIEAVQLCHRCNTRNLHYDPVLDRWVCSFC